MEAEITLLQQRIERESDWQMKMLECQQDHEIDRKRGIGSGPHKQHFKPR
jgi:hypothetical protein